MTRAAPTVMLLVMLASQAAAQDSYNLLRSAADGFATVTPGRNLAFPDDHLAHPDYRIEWWYLTANLTDSGGRHYGVQWTLFRQSLSPAGPIDGWSSRLVWMAHVAVSTPEGHRYRERFARGGIGQAGVKQGADGRFQAWLDDWRLQGQGAAPLPGRLQFELDGMHVELALHSDKPWVLHGDNGYSRKSAQGQASYYYSQPHIRAEGILRRPGGDIRLTGRAWLDREWSSRPLADDQPGWDWFALHLQSGEALMVYRLRHNDGDHWLSGTWIGPDGATTELKAADIRLRALAHSTVDTGSGDQRRLPLTWSLALPGMGREWRIEALYTDQWLGGSFPYWEGPIRATGSGSGIGYMELTGY